MNEDDSGCTFDFGREGRACERKGKERKGEKILHSPNQTEASPNM
jgi:hypothetical protein